MRSSTWLGSWLCALVVTNTLGAALAQGPAPAPAPGEPPGYRELVDEAVSEQSVGNFGEARGLFARAHSLYPNARTLKGLGMAEFELRNYRESAQYLEASLAATVKPLTPKLRAETEQLLVRARRFLGKVRVLVSPSTTQITVDGASAPLDAEGSLLLVAGDHTLDATAVGHEPAHRTLKVNGGDDQTVNFTLTPIPTPTGAALPPTAAAVTATTPGVEPAVAPPPQSSVSKPRRLRLYAGGPLGFAGNQHAKLQLDDQSAEGSNSLAASYGFDVGATFLVLRHFDLGAEVRLSWIKPKDLPATSADAGESQVKRSLLVDVDVKPRLRFDLADGQLEFYLAVPFGLTIPSLPTGIRGNVGWNVGAGAGLTYFFSRHFGLNTEALVLFHGYTGTISGTAAGTPYEATLSLFLWQPSLFVNLVFAL